MIYEIFHDVVRRIREYAGLSKEEVAGAMGLKAQAIWRWEKKDENPLPNREQLAILVKLTKLSRFAFVQIMCEVLSDFLDRQVSISPEGQFLPAPPLSRATTAYAAEKQDLDPESQQLVEAKLHLARSLEALVEQVVHHIAIEVERLIEQHRAARRAAR